jgi:acyl dehydratase
MKTFHGIDELRNAVGSHLGESGWRIVTEREVDLFTDATGGEEWIPIDPDRPTSGPFSSPVAHGYLTLGLIPALVSQIYCVEGIVMSLNYGTNKVRFPAPIPVGSRIRASADLVAVEPASGGFQQILKVTVERAGAAKPVCVAETVSTLLPEPTSVGKAPTPA